VLDRVCRYGWLVAAALAFAVFLPALGYDFTYDDHAIVLENPRIRRLDTPSVYLASNWWGPSRGGFLYRPASMASFALNYAAGELDPSGYHLVNNALHGVAAALLWWLIWMLAGGSAGAARAATLAASLFAVHALHVEAVAGIVGRAELLMSCGYLLALCAAWRSRTAAGRPARIGWAAAAGLAAALAAFSKEHGVTAPAAIALLVWVPAGDAAATKPRLRDRLTALGPAFGFAVLAVALYFAARHAVLGAFVKPDRSLVGGVDNPLVDVEGWTRRQAALAVLVRALGLLVLPLRPSPNYGAAFLDAQALAGGPLWPVGFGLLLLAAIGLATFRRRPLMRVGLGLLILTMALGSNLLVLTGTILGERLLYLPSAAMCVIAAGWIVSAQADRSARATLGTLAVWGVAQLALLIVYLPNWRDNPTLLDYAVRRAPRSVNIQMGCAEQKRVDGDLEGALAHIEEALRLRPSTLDALAWRGIILSELGRADEALRDLERVVAVDTALSAANRELAFLLTTRGQPRRAEWILRQAVIDRPGSVDARVVLADWLMRQGRADNARLVLEPVKGWLSADQRSRLEPYAGP
jgi:uncharacterized protein (TIGR02996 family)